MKTVISVLLIFLRSHASHAAVVTWELVNFTFDDGGTASGTFNFDTEKNTLSDIDIYTSTGSRVEGRHYIALAGEWGMNPDWGTLAFTDTTSTSNYQGAGWFRIDISYFADVTEFQAILEAGVRLDQWLEVGAESYCTNINCSSAANEITDPSNSRETLSGYLLSTDVQAAPVPLPASVWLLLSAFVGLFYIRRRA